MKHCPGWGDQWFLSCDFGPVATPISLQPFIEIGVWVVLILAGALLALFTVWLVMILRSR